MASRTDRGVSARANALVVESRLSGKALLAQLNGIDPAIFCTAASPVPDSFRARSAIRRTYRYYEPGDRHDVNRWRRVASVLEGRLDVRSFGREVPSSNPCWRTVEHLRVAQREGGLEIEVVAPSFVWGMVRKLIGAMREHEAGRLPLARLGDAARGKLRLMLPLAEPEGLVLWEVEYPLPWTVLWSGPYRHQLERLRRERDRLWIGTRLLDSIDARTDTAPG